MKTRVTTFLLTMMLSGIITPLIAQMGVEDGSKYGHGEDSVRCVKNYSLYKGYYDQEDFDRAIMFWRPVFRECPKVSKNIYLHGRIMYLDLYTRTNDEIYLDSVMMVWDQRIEMFGSKGTYTGRKGLDLLSLGFGDPERVQRGLGYLEESLDMLKHRSSDGIMVYYTQATMALFSMGVIDNAMAIENYGKVSDLVDMAIEKNTKPDNKEKYQNAKNVIDNAFKTSGAGTCDGLIPMFTDKVKANPEDRELLEKVLTLLGGAGCSDSDLYYETVGYYYQIERTAERAYQLAQMSLDRALSEKAAQYYKEAIELEDESRNKSNYLVKLAGLVLNENEDIREAYSLAKQAIELDPGNGAAYFIVGNAVGSAKVGDEFENQAVYWLAVDYFVKAKQNSPELEEQVNERINSYSQHFPKKEDCFFRSITEEGTAYRVGGWINETTTVRFRKE